MPFASLRDERMEFSDVIQGLMAGDFSRLAPLFNAPSQHSDCQIVTSHKAGWFNDKPEALDEAFSCACFNGSCEVIKYLIGEGVQPSGGDRTGLNGFHWAANRGQLEAVKILIGNHAPLEMRNAYGGTVLGCTVWAAIHQPQPLQAEVIEALLSAGADVREAQYPTGLNSIDRLLEKFGAQNCER